MACRCHSPSEAVFIDREICELQCYLPRGSGIALPSTAAVPALVIDCGANVGLFALWVAQRCPHAQVLAFEPSPSTYELLCSTDCP